MPRRRFYIFFLVFLSFCWEAARAQTAAPQPSPVPRSAVRDVTFRNVTVLSAREQQDLALSLRRYNPDWIEAQTSEQLADFIAAKALEAYQDKGYWRAKVSAQIIWVNEEDGQRQVDVTISPLSEGEAYWLKDIRWSGVTVFPEEELLRMMPIHPWELISREKVAAGLDVVRKLYASKGYFAYRATPEITFDDAAHSVSLAIAVEEDSPFRFGSLSVAGVDRATSREMQQAWVQMREQLYSQDKLREFFRKFLRPDRPSADPLDHSTTSVDLDTHVVDVQVSLTPATQAEKAEQ